MRRIVYFMHVSLDGFVAGPKGEMDWITVDQEMFDTALYQTNRSDTALYGRVTFQMMDNYWPKAGEKPNATKHDVEHSSWYNSVEKVIISKSMKDEDRPKIRVIHESIVTEIQKLKNQPGKDIVIFGSPSIGHLLTSENLIDDYWLFVNPILLGQGIPLFKSSGSRHQLILITSKVFASGVICLHYEAITERQ